MPEAQRLREAIKRQLKARGLRYLDLAQALGLSEPSVKRLLSRGGITLERLERICEVLETDFFELARTGRRVVEQPNALSLAQEEALAADPRLLTLFHLLCNDWSAADVKQEFGLSEASIVRLLARLDRLKLLELQPENRVRLKVARDFEWRPQGPVMKRWARSAVVEFFRGDFDAADALLRLEVKEFGAASMALLRRRLEKVVQEFNELATVDASLPGSKRRGVGLVIGLRPFAFSLLESLREEVAAKPRHASAEPRGRS